jgi:hypothetical protein
MSNENEKQVTGAIVRQEFGAMEQSRVTETASTAIAAREKASVEARYIVAMRRPRDLEDVRVKLLKECSRPGFADVARYNKPVGKGVEGPSIRFAEAALRCMTNILPEVAVVFEDAEKRILRITVTDLEANLTYATEITVEKTVERRQLKDGQTAISKRTNSTGNTVFLVAATEDDLLNKQNALISKAIRTSGLRLVPGDIVEECMERVIQTQRDRAAKDPDAEKRRIIDAFASIGVTPNELKEYLGHDLSTLQPAQIVDLRAIFTTIKDGEATWNAVMESKGKGKKQKPPIEQAPEPAPVEKPVAPPPEPEPPAMTLDQRLAEVYLKATPEDRAQVCGECALADIQAGSDDGKLMVIGQLSALAVKRHDAAAAVEATGTTGNQLPLGGNPAPKSPRAPKRA